MRIIIPIILLFIGFHGNAQRELDAVLKKFNSNSIPYITVEEARQLQLSDKLILFDARESEEFEVSHIPSATHVGYKNFTQKNVPIPIDSTDKIVVVYCSIGVRSEKIAEKIQKMGFPDVRNLYGGIFEWSNNGFPLLDQSNQPTQKVHAYSKEWAPYLTKGIKVY